MWKESGVLSPFPFFSNTPFGAIVLRLGKTPKWKMGKIGNEMGTIITLGAAHIQF